MSRLHRDHRVLRQGADGYIDDPKDHDFASAARWALKEGNVPLAFEQVSAAIALSPLHEPHLRLLDEIIARARGPLQYLKLPEAGAFFGLCAVRARVLSRLGRLEEALQHLLEAAAFSPRTPFLPWARRWVESAKSARSVSPEAMAAGLVSLTSAVRALREIDDGTALNLEAALHVAKRIQEQHPASTSLLIARSRMLRLLGRSAEALSLLDGTAAWETHVERAAVHRELGDHEARARALEQAIDARPEEASTHIDLGEAYLDDGRLGAAVTAYGRALALEPSSDWAQISVAYARALALGAREPLGRIEITLSSAVGIRARILEADLAAYVTRLSDPIDPVIGVIRSVHGRAAQVASPARLRFRVRAERPLAPSAYVAFSHELAGCGREGVLIVEHEGPPPKLGPLWKAGDSRADPAVPPPPEAVLERARALAQQPFSWNAWCAKARDLSATLDPRAAETLIHAMAYPSPPPTAEADAARWVHGFQIAAALLLALGPGLPAARMSHLLPLLSAIDDWSAGAALLGLGALAEAELALKPEILDRLSALLPDQHEPLPPLARALAVAGGAIASGEDQRAFLRLRARVRADFELVAQEAKVLE